MTTGSLLLFVLFAAILVVFVARLIKISTNKNDQPEPKLKDHNFEGRYVVYIVKDDTGFEIVFDTDSFSEMVKEAEHLARTKQMFMVWDNVKNDWLEMGSDF